MNKILIIILLFCPTLAFAQASYARIDNQNFTHTVAVPVNYDNLKTQWVLAQRQIDRYRAIQIKLEAQMADLEALGAKASHK